MKVALCCIGRLENNYAIEYVEYNKKIGFDKIFIYDNNYDGEEHFEDVLQPFIDNGLVEIVDYRNKTLCQMKSYEECYNAHKNEYDWIAFFDFDEYISFKNNETIKEYLSDKVLNGFECIHINWMYYGDNGNVRYDNRPLEERFTKPSDYNLKITYDFPENNHVKSIVRGGIKNFKWIKNTHSPGIGLKCCNGIGEKCEDDAFNTYNFDRCYLKHFATKTIEEWVKYRMKRGNADITYKEFRKTVNVDRFFLVNERTKEKEDLMNKLLFEIDNPKHQDNNIDIFIGTQKTFKPVVSNNIYKIVVGNHEIENNSNLELIKCKHKSLLDDKFYSEIYMLSHIAREYPLKKYVGFCHNRRYFNFLDDIPNIDKLFESFEAVTAKPLVYKYTVKAQYGAAHNIEDLYIIGGILADKFPQYCKTWHNFINGKILIPYNMFIMKRENFIEYINFINAVINEYIKITGGNIEKRIENNKDKYIKTFYPNNDPQYQYRIGGYLAERLTNLFIMTHFNKIKTYPVITTEDKYNQNKKDNS